MGEVVRIGSVIIFHLSKLWKAKFSILRDVIFLVRLQEKFDIDHSWEWKSSCDFWFPFLVKKKTSPYPHLPYNIILYYNIVDDDGDDSDNEDHDDDRDGDKEDEMMMYVMMIVMTMMMVVVVVVTTTM